MTELSATSGALLFVASAITGGCAGALFSNRWPQYRHWHFAIGLVAQVAIWVIITRNP